jgi:hypothetical protein
MAFKTGFWLISGLEKLAFGRAFGLYPWSKKSLASKGDWGVFRTLFLNHHIIPNLEPISKSNKKNILFLHPLSLIFDLQTRFFTCHIWNMREVLV